MRRMKRLVPLLALWVVATAVGASSDNLQPANLPVVRVQALRLDIAPFDLPVALSVRELALADQGRPGVSLSEALTGVPGVLARHRQNYAQDEQLSVRGFGARSTFGVRGVRLYADGIPATMPDGQGQLSHFNLDAAGRVEVLRGPFSSLYGQSSGGVVQLWSADGDAMPFSALAVSMGSDAAAKVGASTRGVTGPLNYNLALSRFQTDGYRDHSRARRDAGNARLGFDLGQGRQLTLVGNGLRQPYAQDPLGLSRADYAANPRQAPALAKAYNTGKRLRQHQFGASFLQPLGERDALRIMAYGGVRSMRQQLAIPAAAQRNPLSAGGVIDLGGDYSGADVRWTHRGRAFGRPWELVLGTSRDSQAQRRRGYENFVGEQTGVRGRLRRNEDASVAANDRYVQLYWQLADDWSLLAGARRSVVRFRVRDHYVTADNPDDSGRVRHAATTPAFGLHYRPSASWRLYASIGEGFETPTLAELGYRADGGSGLAFDLRPARSRHRELGAKWRAHAALEGSVAVFRADTRNELAVAGSQGGRSTYRNIGHSRRQGVEAAMDAELPRAWRVRAGLTWLQATFGGAARRCDSAPCASTPVGTRIPGVPRLHGALRLERGDALGWHGGVEFDGIGAVVVDDRNSASAPGYLRTGVDLGYGMALGATRLHVSARVDNLFDRRIIGSVIVNDGNGRYYEPAPGRSVMLGVRLER